MATDRLNVVIVNCQLRQMEIILLESGLVAKQPNSVLVVKCQVVWSLSVK